MKEPQLNLYVWDDFAPDYSAGLAFAIAKDETDAREQVEKACGYCPSFWGDMHVHPITDRVSYACTGGS